MEQSAISANEQPSPLNLAPPQRTHHSVWNFETVCFDVESKLFTVIKNDLLVPGSVFVDMFRVPSGDEPAEGKDENNPIVLHGTKANHFHVFLSVLYPWATGSVRLEEQNEGTLLGVLRLANMWHFPAVRDRAIPILTKSHIRTKDSPKKIRLGEKYYVQEWALDGYAAIVRMRGLKFGELEKSPYNFDDVVIKKILHLQVNYGPGPVHTNPNGYSSTCNGYQPEQGVVETAVKELLSDELARASLLPYWDSLHHRRQNTHRLHPSPGHEMERLDSEVTGAAPQQRKLHAIWDFETVHFQVEDEIFEVIKKDLLVPGSFFVDMFELPQQVEGNDPDHPIPLYEIQAAHFSALLTELSPWVPNAVRLEEQDEATCLGVLRLANRWLFPKVRGRAIHLLTSSTINGKDSVEKIRFGKDYQVRDWALQGYTEIIQKDEMEYGDLEKDPYNKLSDTEVKKILYLQARHGFAGHRRMKCRRPCKACAYSGFDVNAAVKELLLDEIAEP
ncbi:hypothetical protein D9619_009664 [Psilocybe cf. subviscida]|uniref:BTB domain-containing protein n=1 Tax=Psilocybe cf. subviscida TaxID=2480587 RepID=A0A8H5F6A9_9AGAR|nr:hypothetical protein D9619_009664 [Psilocybe cf. subviscida]